MEGLFFKKAATFVDDNMTPCSYSRHAIEQLNAMDVRLQEKNVNGDDLNFVRNVGVLLTCAWEDWLDGGSEDRLTERGRQHKKELQDLETLLPGIIASVQKHVMTESVSLEVAEISTHSALQLTSKLEEARNDAQMLEQRLVSIISEMRGGSGSAKRAYPGPLHVYLQTLKEL
jgi:hypothetical protein